jgi:hypothetical protein
MPLSILPSNWPFGCRTVTLIVINLQGFSIIAVQNDKMLALWERALTCYDIIFGATKDMIL